MEQSFADKVKSLPKDVWTSEEIFIRSIQDEDDLWYAVVECSLIKEQQENVNPAGFSIGRAYLTPHDNVPCVICKADGERIGFISFLKWLGEGIGFSWSYYIDKNYQGLGYGKAAARLAVNILKAVDPKMPIKLAAEAANTKAHRLYQSIGFTKSEEMDGDDRVFIL